MKRDRARAAARALAAEVGEPAAEPVAGGSEQPRGGGGSGGALGERDQGKFVFP